MANYPLQINKVVSALPSTLTANMLYAVRVGTGYDLYLADATASKAYKLNLDVGNLTGTVPVANGGTGASDVATARNNLGLKAIVTRDIASSQTAYWDAVPYIQADGVVEFGKYIDFHATSSLVTDYDVRLQAEKGFLLCSGFMQMTSVIAGSASYKKGWRKLSVTLPSSAGEVTIAHNITTIETLQGKVTDSDGLIVCNNDPDPVRQFYIRVNGANVVVGVGNNATKVFGKTVTIYVGEEL